MIKPTTLTIAFALLTYLVGGCQKSQDKPKPIKIDEYLRRQTQATKTASLRIQKKGDELKKRGVSGDEYNRLMAIEKKAADDDLEKTMRENMKLLPNGGGKQK